jgi:hypothetical protein
MEQSPPLKKGPPGWVSVFVVVVMGVGALLRPTLQAWVKTLPGISAFILYLVAAVVVGVCIVLVEILNRPKSDA